MSSLRCALCRGKFPDSEFAEGGALVLLGRNVCRFCVEKHTLYCSFCRGAIGSKDFEEGRAVTLLGKRYCETCLAAAVERSKPAGRTGSSPGRPIQVTPTPAPQRPPSAQELPLPGPEGRLFERFVPPREARLHIRPAGLGGMLGGNRVKMWLDVSEGGLRAIVEGNFEKGDEIKAELKHPPAGASCAVFLKVRHSNASKSFPGCSVVGFKFVDPDRELRNLIQEHFRRHPLLFEMEGEAAAPPPPASPSAAPKAG